MKRTKEFYIWLVIMQLFIVALWFLMKIGLYRISTMPIEDMFIILWYIPIILKAYDIGYRQRGWDLGVDN